MNHGHDMRFLYSSNAFTYCLKVGCARWIGIESILDIKFKLPYSFYVVTYSFDEKY